MIGIACRFGSFVRFRGECLAYLARCLPDLPKQRVEFAFLGIFRFQMAARLGQAIPNAQHDHVSKSAASFEGDIAYRVCRISRNSPNCPSQRGFPPRLFRLGSACVHQRSGGGGSRPARMRTGVPDPSGQSTLLPRATPPHFGGVAGWLVRPVRRRRVLAAGTAKGVAHLGAGPYWLSDYPMVQARRGDGGR